MILTLGERWDLCPDAWKNMIIHIHEIDGLPNYISVEHSRLYEYIYDIFRGRLAIDFSCVDFDCEEHYTWFLLRWS